MEKPVIDKQSVSEILRSSAILLIRLDDVALSPWVGETNGDLLIRDVTMTVIIEEILKGKVQQKVGESFELKVQQRGTGGFRVMDYYGLWSHSPLSAGVRFVAFCTDSSEDARILLSTDANCEQLMEPKIALADTKSALELENQNPSSADLIARAQTLSRQRGGIFARYVWAKIKPEAMNSLDIFEKVVKIIEDPETTELARESYLTSIEDALGITDPPLKQWEFRFIRSMFNLLTLSEAKPLHTNIEEVYLPNILGLDEDVLRYSANEIFKDRVDERMSILSSLKYRRKSEFTPRLIQWLEAK